MGEVHYCNANSSRAKLWVNINKITDQMSLVSLDCRISSYLFHRPVQGFNTGSLILRNTPWTLHHLAVAWNTTGPHIPRSSIWWEQAALIHLYDSDEEVRKHYLILPQKAINAYPQAPAAGGGAVPGAVYVEGDFVVHFVDYMKQWLFDASESWLQRVPLSELAAEMPHEGISIETLKQQGTLPAVHRVRPQLRSTVDATGSRSNHSSGGGGSGRPCAVVNVSLTVIRPAVSTAETAADSKAGGRPDSSFTNPGIAVFSGSFEIIPRQSPPNMSISHPINRNKPSGVLLRPNPGWPVAVPPLISAFAKAYYHHPEKHYRRSG